MKLYSKPEQPPPEIKARKRRSAFSSSTISDQTLCAALSVKMTVCSEAVSVSFVVVGFGSVLCVVFILAYAVKGGLY